MDIPNFDLGINELDIMKKEEFSSSGDELLLSVAAAEPETTRSTSSKRFLKTSIEDRDKLLLDTESKNTQKSTKYAVKIFKSI